MPGRIERALITGASAGLGVEFARQLADRGVALTLVARREDRLTALADTLPVDVEVLPADLTAADGLATVEARVAATDRPVDLLVNNAGFGAYGTFSDLSITRQREMLDLNVAAPVQLTHAAVGPMLARRSGGVLNVGSTAAYQPNPSSAVYGATKAFVRSFTEALHEELRSSGVHVMLLSPGFTETEFQQVASVAEEALPAPLRMAARDVVATALRDFGRGRAVSVPGVSNKLNVAAVDVTPSVITRKASRVVHERFAG